MKINFNSKNSNTPADVVITKTGIICTNLWDASTYRMITDKDIVSEILKIQSVEGRKGIKSAPIWKALLDKDMNEISRTYDPKEIWGKGTVMNTTDGNSVEITTTSKIVRKPRKNPAAIRLADTPIRELADPVELVRTWIKFFSEFHFNPQVRFINSLARCQDVNELNEYVIGYFSLTNNSYLNELQEKMKSDEYKELAEKTYNTTNKIINDRLEIYYGEPGGGKTTKAIKDHPEAEVVICHAAMTPDELFRGFDFTEEGKPTFKPCPLKNAMLEGKVVILDEINLLNEDCRRALQALCDGKESISINNEEIAIKPGFRVVGTMNLVVDEQVFGLPAPLVDRACKIQEFKMPASKLAGLAI